MLLALKAAKSSRESSGFAKLKITNPYDKPSLNFPMVIQIIWIKSIPAVL